MLTSIQSQQSIRQKGPSGQTIISEIKIQQSNKELLQKELSALQGRADARNNSGNSVQSAIATIEGNQQAQTKFRQSQFAQKGG